MKLRLGRKAAPVTSREPVRVYTSQGRIAHLRVGDGTLCPFGTGAVPGSDEQRSLPLCKFCRDALADRAGT